jgi:hypothetical protein
MSKFIGKKFGKLTVLSSGTKQTSGGNYRQIFELRCDCGKVYHTSAAPIIKGNSTQCNDCRKSEYAAKSSSGYKHQLYTVWWGMVWRCHDERAKMFEYYGARGIHVCDRWRGSRQDSPVASMDGFKNFLADMGDRPEGATIDRIDVNGNYEPTNCRWATISEQANNKRSNVFIEFEGQRLTISEWSIKLGIPYFWYQISVKYNLDPVEALARIKSNLPLGKRVKWQTIFGIDRKIQQNPKRGRQVNFEKRVLLDDDCRERFRKMFGS